MKHEDNQLVELLIERLDELRDFATKTMEDISEINITLAKQEAQLAEHMRRTALAEAAIQETKEVLKPLVARHQMVNGAGKTLGIIGTILAAVGGLAVSIWEILKNNGIR